MSNIVAVYTANDPRIDPEFTANHTANTAKFTGKREKTKKVKVEENLTVNELLIKIKIDNFDVDVPFEEIEKICTSEQIYYYQNCLLKLKKEIHNSNNSFLEMFKDNLECGKEIDRLKACIFNLTKEHERLSAEYKELKEDYDTLHDKRKLKLKLRQAKQAQRRANKINAESNAVKKRLESAGVSTVTQRMVDDMIRLRNQGKIYSEIAQKMNVSTATVSKYLKRNKDRLNEFDN